MIASRQLQQRLLITGDVFQDSSSFHYGRKLLQVDSSSTNTTQSSTFIALLCVIGVLTVAFVICVIILCYRYYSYREEKANYKRKPRRIFSDRTDLPTPRPPVVASSYSTQSTRDLFSNQDELQNISTTKTVASRYLHQSIVDAYLNDLKSVQPANLDVKQLHSYLFIDLHSTSSETFPDTVSRQLLSSTTSSGYDTATGQESPHRSRYTRQQRGRHRSILTVKRETKSRFLMRERSLPSNPSQLPQLRSSITQQKRHRFGMDDSNTSSMTITNEEPQSTTISSTTNDFDDSHAYHVNQNYIMQTIREEKLPHLQPARSVYPVYYKEESPVFEVVSTFRGDDSDLRIHYNSSPRLMDNSIIV